MRSINVELCRNCELDYATWHYGFLVGTLLDSKVWLPEIGASNGNHDYERDSSFGFINGR